MEMQKDEDLYLGLRAKCKVQGARELFVNG